MTKLKNIISTTEARKNIFQLTEDVQKNGNYYLLTENGKSKAVILSAKDFENIQAALDDLAEDPDLPELMAEADEAVRTGDYSNYISFDQYLKEEGLTVAEKGGEYVVQRAAKPRSQKKSPKAPAKDKGKSRE